jgi:hypothetical protein
MNPDSHLTLIAHNASEIRQAHLAAKTIDQPRSVIFLLDLRDHVARGMAEMAVGKPCIGAMIAGARKAKEIPTAALSMPLDMAKDILDGIHAELFPSDVEPKLSQKDSIVVVVMSQSKALVHALPELPPEN